ncbi:hypothetical protein GCM10008955_36040 [Deinococcus malanensis]|uniref:Alkylmercury lyase n=1 Tax=Deinococcus malanensis TaxID=1706855 RepID=A0ABQ2F4G1_9DEIO|nr:organomercurial lyase [Deinococcus malanensis]GGK38980.1 hypothetical protein GCM10008955_36040 [Deinococcus malanensis]
MPEMTTLPAPLAALLNCCEGQSPEAMLRGFVMFTPTPHVIHTQAGVRIYTRCALDTLLAAWILDENIDIVTTPPGATQSLEFTVRNGQLHSPSDAVLALPTQPDTRSAEKVYRSFCPYALAFPNVEAYQAWSNTATVPTTPVTFQDAYRLSRDFIGHLAHLSTLDGHGGTRCC